MDVLMDYASKLRHDDDEQACSVRLLEHLGAQRLKKARKFLAVTQRCATKLDKAEAHLRKTRKSPASEDGVWRSQDHSQLRRSCDGIAAGFRACQRFARELEELALLSLESQRTAKPPEVG
jgi:hypothetical protein